jgi:hypothetical protein
MKHTMGKAHRLVVDHSLEANCFFSSFPTNNAKIGCLGCWRIVVWNLFYGQNKFGWSTKTYVTTIFYTLSFLFISIELCFLLHLIEVLMGKFQSGKNASNIFAFNIMTTRGMSRRSLCVCGEIASGVFA